MKDRPTVAVVHLGTAGSMGGRRRVASLTAIFTAAGADVVEVPLLVDHRLGLRDLPRLGLGSVVCGRSVPESLAWSHRSAVAELRRVDADLVVCATVRAFHSALLHGPWTVVIDYVDKLSDSYLDRSRIVGRTPRSLLFRTLAATAGRFERRPLPPGTRGIAAGWDDAQALGLDWVPITVDIPAPPQPNTLNPAPRHDILFLGKLSYPPNVEAIERLDRIWPTIAHARPGTTLVLAGAAPSEAVLDLANRHRWSVLADFTDLADVAASARIATAPLHHASGIQIKVLEAAAFGLPQVIGTAVAKGFGPNLPAIVIESDDELVSALTDLLNNPAEQARIGAAAQAHMAERYSVERWAPWAAALLDDLALSGRHPRSP